MERVRPQSAFDAPTRRKSIFMEVGLVDEVTAKRDRSPTPILMKEESPQRQRPSRMVRFRSQNEIFDEREEYNEESEWESASDDDDNTEYNSTETTLHTNQHVMSHTKFYRLGLLTIILALMLPIIHLNPVARVGVRGGIIPRGSVESHSAAVVKREDTNTDACKRWAGQTAVVNGTLYMYGFRTTTDAKQDSDTWSNNFLTLDLKKSWQIANPSLTGLPQPSGVPEVSLGYLWASHDSLWLYGGQFSDNPKQSPGPNSVWEYNIHNQQWNEHKDPKSSSGDNAADEGQSIQRSAEGAGFSVSVLGRGWYFAGHLDDFTTEGWSNQIPRLYLKSLLEFTFPGYSNNAVESLRDGKTAGPEGVYRNITEGGTQGTSSFPERADSALVYVPGFGEEGILVGLTGGDNDTFTQMNVIDVYDIAKSEWYKQSTSGKQPKYRVNPCAVVAAAADGSSYNVYMFGGQNLQPAGEQIQYDDMWILSIPSFTWIEVDMSTQSVPPARAGHSCHVWDSQMIVVGGYVGQELSCDTPGIYVFNMSSLSWGDQFTALTGDRALQSFSKDGDTGNPLAQQGNQRGFDLNAGLEGSYGYSVPEAVQKVIGGEATGGATLTAPIQTPSAGPLATGKPHTYTVTGPDGAIITEVVNGGGNGGGGTNVGAIAAGTVAGVCFLVAAYFAFCAWVYRKRVQIWKNHAAMVAARSDQEKRAAGTYTSSSAGGRVSSERPPNFLASMGGSSTGRPSNDVGPGAGGDTSYMGAAAMERRSSEGSVSDELLSGQEPTFWGTRGVLLNPRRSLRVINRD